MNDLTPQTDKKSENQHSLFRLGLSWFEIVLGGMLVVVGVIVLIVGEEKVITFILTKFFPSLANENVNSNPAQFFIDLIRFAEFSFGFWFISFPALIFIVLAADIVGLMSGVTLLITGLTLRANGWRPWFVQVLIPINILLALLIWTADFSTAPPFPE